MKLCRQWIPLPRCREAYFDVGLSYASLGRFVAPSVDTEIKTYLVEFLIKQDQMSMAASIKSRVPFLDHVLVGFAATIPANTQYAEWLENLISVGVEDLLPKDILFRRKLGFPTPWAYWLAGPQLLSVA